MCGIIAGFDEGAVAKGVKASRYRGPDASGVKTVSGVSLGHARLAIVDLDARSDQPFTYGRTVVSFNGEIWNFKQVRSALAADGLTFRTEGDTEVVAACLDRLGVSGLQILDGMFAVAWTTGDGILHLARDRFGEIPLHWTPEGAASELKIFQSAGMAGPAGYVPPGGVVSLQLGRDPQERTWHPNEPSEALATLDEAALRVRVLLTKGVADRTMADVPVCTLLSGGLDSTAVAWAAKQVMPSLVAYTAVLDEKSADLKMARHAAEQIGIELREVKVTAPTSWDLSRVVSVIEMPHKAQVEIGWACLQLADRICRDGFKVVFSGEGSDELWGSYGFSYHGIKAQGFGPYRRQAFLDQHRKNFARCNKIFMARSVECRLPFLHPPLVDFAWSLPETAVRFGSRPKAVLEEAFRDVLPKRIVERSKVAFQDGMGLKDAAAQAIDGDARTFYQVEYEKRYADLDRGRGAVADGKPAGADHGKVRREAGGVQQSLWS